MSRLAILCLSLTILGCGGAQDAPKKPLTDEERIQGSWTVEKAVEDGEAVPSARTEKISVIITETQFETQGDEVAEVVRYKIDSSKTPGHIDLTNLTEEKKGPPFLGLYRFEGDKLEISFLYKEDKPNVRPDDFTSTKKNGHSVMLLNRKK